jgi:hypothetical protein
MQRSCLVKLLHIALAQTHRGPGAAGVGHNGAVCRGNRTRRDMNDKLTVTSKLQLLFMKLHLRDDVCLLPALFEAFP